MEKLIDAPAKVRALRKDHGPTDIAIRTDFEVTEIAGEPAVVGHAVVVLVATETVLAEAYSTRGLRALKPGVQGMKDTRDAERAMTGAVGRALFLMGYGERPDDSADYETEEPVDWFKANGWRDQDHHDSFMADAKAAMKEVAATTARDEMVSEWERRGLKWPLTYEQMTEWSKFLVPLARKTQAGAGETGDRAESEPVSQPSLDDAVGPDAPLVKR